MATYMESGIKSDDEKREYRRKQVMIGDLPTDFLRVVPVSESKQLSADEEAAIALQQEVSVAELVALMYGRLTITVFEAKLNKNYGIARMDPYVRATINQKMFETMTSYNGAKNPQWGQTFFTYLFQPGENNVFFEIFDERSFTIDEKIAWGFFVVPEKVFQGESVEEWIPLSGKLGEEKEGSLKLAVKYTPPIGPAPLSRDDAILYNYSNVEFVGGVKPEAPPSENIFSMSRWKSPFRNTKRPPSPVLANYERDFPEDTFRQIQEMFPNYETPVIRNVMANNKNNKELTINALIAMSEDT